MTHHLIPAYHFSLLRVRLTTDRSTTLWEEPITPYLAPGFARQQMEARCQALQATLGRIGIPLVYTIEEVDDDTAQ